MKTTTITVDADHYTPKTDSPKDLPNWTMEAIAQTQKDGVWYTISRTASLHLVIQAAHMHSGLLNATGERSVTVTDVLIFSLPDLLDASASIFAGDSDSEIDYKGWALAMCELLDSVGAHVADGDQDGAMAALASRFALAEHFGLTVEVLGKTSGGVH